MSDKEQLAALIKEVVTIIKDTRDFTVAQAPDIAREIILWAQFKPAISVVLFIAVTWLAVISWRKFIEKENKRDYSLSTLLMAASAVLSVASIALFIASLVDIYNALHATIAPKAYILEYLTKML